MTKNGVKYGKFRDRSWVLFNKYDELIAIKNEPKLALTKCTIHGDNELWIDAPDMETLKLKLIENIDKNHKICEIQVYEEKMNGIDCGENVHKWFETFLGKPGIRLFQHHPDLCTRRMRTHGRSKEEKKFPIIFQNKAGVHLNNMESIKDLNSKFSTDNFVDYRNFRPNILIEGIPAYDEDKWHFININGVTLKQILRCDRCPSTTVNQDTGVMGQETLKALNRDRPSNKFNGNKIKLGPYFGVIYVPLTYGIMRCNDKIMVEYGKNLLN